MSDKKINPFAPWLPPAEESEPKKDDEPKESKVLPAVKPFTVISTRLNELAKKT